MVLGQSAAKAAAQSIDANVAVQDIDYAKLRQRLLADKQVLQEQYVHEFAQQGAPAHADKPRSMKSFMKAAMTNIYEVPPRRGQSLILGQMLCHDHLVDRF